MGTSELGLLKVLQSSLNNKFNTKQYIENQPQLYNERILI